MASLLAADASQHADSAAPAERFSVTAVPAALEQLSERVVDVGYHFLAASEDAAQGVSSWLAPLRGDWFGAVRGEADRALERGAQRRREAVAAARAAGLPSWAPREGAATQHLGRVAHAQPGFRAAALWSLPALPSDEETSAAAWSEGLKLRRAEAAERAQAELQERCDEARAALVRELGAAELEAARGLEAASASLDGALAQSHARLALRCAALDARLAHLQAEALRCAAAELGEAGEPSTSAHALAQHIARRLLSLPPPPPPQQLFAAGAQAANAEEVEEALAAAAALARDTALREAALARAQALQLAARAAVEAERAAAREWVLREDRDRQQHLDSLAAQLARTLPPQPQHSLPPVRTAPPPPPPPPPRSPSPPPFVLGAACAVRAALPASTSSLPMGWASPGPSSPAAVFAPAPLSPPPRRWPFTDVVAQSVEVEPPAASARSRSGPSLAAKR